MHKLLYSKAVLAAASGLTVTLGFPVPSQAIAQDDGFDVLPLDNAFTVEITKSTEDQHLNLKASSEDSEDSSVDFEVASMHVDEHILDTQSRSISPTINLAPGDRFATLNRSVLQQADLTYHYTPLPELTGVEEWSDRATTEASFEPSRTSLETLNSEESIDYGFADSRFMAQTPDEPENTDESENANESDLADSSDEPNERNWTFEFTPFVFLPVSVEGSSTVEGITADVDLDLGEVLDLFSFGAFGRVEAWHKNRIGLIFEGAYVELNEQSENLLDPPPIPGVLGLSLDADVTYQQSFYDFAVALRTPISSGSDDDPIPRYGLSEGFFDVMAGLRVQHLEQDVDLDFELSTVIGPIEFNESFEGDETWVEPLFGARAGVFVAPKFTLFSRFDISGFGIDGLSMTFRALGGLDWRFWGDTSLKAGYTLYTIDFEEDGFGVDQLQHGPFLAVTVRF